MAPHVVARQQLALVRLASGSRGLGGSWQRLMATVRRVVRADERPKALIARLGLIQHAVRERCEHWAHGFQPVYATRECTRGAHPRESLRGARRRRSSEAGEAVQLAMAEGHPVSGC
jgi:hypothetical protein